MRTATFEHSIDVLVKAYFNGTLTHGQDCACAVGNLISDACGFEPGLADTAWFGYIHNLHAYKATHKLGKQHVLATGYSKREIYRIERAFEDFGNHTDKDGYKGLMAVVDVLAEIHGIDLEQKETAKGLFVKVPL